MRQSYLLVFLFLGIIRGQNSPKLPTVSDLIMLKKVKEVQISPDGKWIAYTVSTVDTVKDKNLTQLWMSPVEGGKAIPMTTSNYNAGHPRWSPDGKYLSFLSARGEDAKSQVWSLNRLGGDAIQITYVPQGVSGFEWSPDGEKLLLLIQDPKPEDLTPNKEDDKKIKPVVVDRLQFKQDYIGYLDRNRTHLYTFVPGDSVPIQITSGDFDDSQPEWSPDGKKIAFVSNRTLNPDANDNSDIWIVAADNSDKEKNLIQVTKNQNADHSPTWSPDGNQISYITVTDNEAMWYATQHLAIIPSGGGKSQLVLPELDRNCINPRFTADGKSILFLLEDDGRQELASAKVSTASYHRLISGDHAIGDFDIREDLIVLNMENSHNPSEIYTWKGGKLNKVTNTNQKALDLLVKPIIERISFKSTDGTQISGFVVKPHDFRKDTKYPTVLWLHGGPVSQYDHSFHSPSQLFAAHGYITLLLNPRGSSGYGQAFSQAIFADWGTKDFEDVMSGIEYAIAEGYTDPDKLAVGGWSYGGILTNYVITKSNRFKAAVSGASEALYRSNYGHDHYQLTWEQELGLPWETPENWERISPFNQVANIETPTLWMGGSDDWNVPILNSEQMYQAMKRLGRETKLVVYPGEHHGISRPSFQLDRMKRWVDWFETYIRD